MELIGRSLLGLGLAVGILAGCSGGAPTSAPPVTAKVTEWKDMSKEEKIKFVKEHKQMPESTKQDLLRKVEAGIE